MLSPEQVAILRAHFTEEDARGPTCMCDFNSEAAALCDSHEQFRRALDEKETQIERLREDSARVVEILRALLDKRGERGAQQVAGFYSRAEITRAIMTARGLDKHHAARSPVPVSPTTKRDA